MSKMISVSQFKKVLENKPQEIARMVRVLPYMIEQEIKTTNNKKVINGLEKRLIIAQGFYALSQIGV
jgi:hypothetical protein